MRGSRSQEEQFYCVAATYDLEGATVPFYWGTVISVYNQNNNLRVNGEPNFDPGSRVAPLCARDVDAANGKLSVAPCFLPNFLTGPYWVIATVSVNGTYAAAAVIGGNPTAELSDGCTTPETDQGGLVGGGTGLWLFAREPVASASLMAEVKAKIRALGVATSRLKQVAQANCSYDGFFLKPTAGPPPSPPAPPPPPVTWGWGRGWGWLWSWTDGWRWGWGWGWGWH